ncbi:hypothetical protein MUN81_04070 [Hymenobacter sp. 5317J-9]|uniref:hypothetical protein n=1 Tax=Hymenobacter sp. 5317J-9 TaxID=2932250 RepID=UPI001FD6C36E|nr:hypothetical protein [Hymenobacter sp. 5317J-9]UOQ98673.1 hypothetical protein MUN81_04070 [Hymenobacter sp. 5317J-9]
MNKRPLFLALMLLSLLGGCKKEPAPEPPTDPLSLLPPETQTGQSTFGCLLNGQAWLPAGNPTAGITFTTQYFNGSLKISCPRAFSSQDGTRVNQAIVFSIDSVFAAGNYVIDGKNGRTLTFSDYLSNCTWVSSASSPAQMQLTRMDLVNRIVSGRFSFTLETPGCSRIVVTYGRFDSRF